MGETINRVNGLMPSQLNPGTAYALWCLCFLGICGGQRFYAGQVGGGLLYLFTFGLFGFGQLLDLILIPGMVEKRNVYLERIASNTNPAVTFNIGRIPQVDVPTASPSLSPTQLMLRAAQEKGGLLSAAQIVLATGLEPQEAKKLVQDALREGLAEVVNDEETGAVRYKFDV